MGAPSFSRLVRKGWETMQPTCPLQKQPTAQKKRRVTHCTRMSPLPLLPSGPGGVGGITSRRTRHLLILPPRRRTKKRSRQQHRRPGFPIIRKPLRKKLTNPAWRCARPATTSIAPARLDGDDVRAGRKPVPAGKEVQCAAGSISSRLPFFDRMKSFRAPSSETTRRSPAHASPEGLRNRGILAKIFGAALGCAIE